MQRPMFHPEPARTVEVAGIPRSMIFDLVLKRTFLEGANSRCRGKVCRLPKRPIGRAGTYAIEVSGEVLSVFDPIVHQPAAEQPEDIDPRWLLCHRPFLTVDGEMRTDMLEPHVGHIVRSQVRPLWGRPSLCVVCRLRAARHSGRRKRSSAPPRL
jgi:hypothetical protein